MGTRTMKQRIAEVSRRILGPSPQQLMAGILADQAEFDKKLHALFSNHKPDAEYCVRCDNPVAANRIEWVDDQAYCEKCYGKLPEIDVDAEEEHLEDARENEVLGQ